MKNTNGTSWQLPAPETILRDEGEGRSPEEHSQRDQLAERVAIVAERNHWNRSEVARRIGMPDGTFSQWWSGKYAGRLDTTNAKVDAWLNIVDDMQEMAARIPNSPAFIKTRTPDELTDLFHIAQSMPAMVLGTCEAGMGKTFTARRYLAGHANCWIATMTPYTRTVHGTLQTVARAVGINRFSNGEIVSAIGERIGKKSAPTLLIIDESQNLIDEAINQLRHFVDEYDCGVALLGNTESYTRFVQWSDGPRYGQLRRRVFKRIRHERPSREDLQAFIQAWGISDKDQTEFLVGVGMKPGAYGQIDMTVKLARMTAQGGGREMTLADLKKAWKARDVELKQ